MAKKQQKKKVGTKQPPLPRPKEFLDLIAPAAVQFNTDSFVLGGTYRCVMALRSYPPTTEQLALLSQLGELGGVTLHLTARQVTAAEENAILHTATNKSRMERGNLNNMKQSVTAEAKLQDVATLITTLRREQEPKTLWPAGLTERKPSRWRRNRGSAPSLARISMALT